MTFNYVKHEPYEEGASIYVSKFICDDKTGDGVGRIRRYWNNFAL